jgi:hypothetical protein
VVVTLPPPEPGVHLTLVQQRIDEGTRRVGLRIENVTERALRVREVGLDWPGYGTFTVPSAHRVGAGATLDLPFLLPRERCSADVTDRPEGIAVTRSGVIRDEVDDMGVRFAERLWRSGCALRRIRRVASFSYGGPWQVRGEGVESALATSLRVERRTGSARVRLVDVQGSVLFDLRPSGRTTLDPTQRSGNLPLRISPGRCDQHARSQASQPFAFRLFLRIGADPQVVAMVLTPTRAQQVDLLAFLDDACVSG